MGDKLQAGVGLQMQMTQWILLLVITVEGYGGHDPGEMLPLHWESSG